MDVSMSVWENSRTELSCSPADSHTCPLPLPLPLPPLAVDLPQPVERVSKVEQARLRFPWELQLPGERSHHCKAATGFGPHSPGIVRVVSLAISLAILALDCRVAYSEGKLRRDQFWELDAADSPTAIRLRVPETWASVLRHGRSSHYEIKGRSQQPSKNPSLNYCCRSAIYVCIQHMHTHNRSPSGTCVPSSIFRPLQHGSNFSLAVYSCSRSFQIEQPHRQALQ